MSTGTHFLLGTFEAEAFDRVRARTFSCELACTRVVIITLVFLYLAASTLKFVASVHVTFKLPVI